jgi:2-iminobutanoate/2-iminopropanoate deaminase
MTIKRTSSGVGLPAGFPFSLAGEGYGLCFISGMPALDPDGKFVSGTFEEETELAWHNVAAIAQASGCSLDDIVYVQCVLSDIDNYGDLNDWWRRQFPDISTAPARFTFQAGALPFGAKIEIQAIAARGNRVRRTPVMRVEATQLTRSHPAFCGT